MAKLPTAIDVTGAVAPRQMPGVRVPAGAFGEDIGKATSELGAVLQQEADKQLDLDNKAEAQELSNELNTRMRALEIGDGDQETGYRNALGKAAMDSRGDYEQRAEDLRKELMARATNDTVRRTFGAVAVNRVGRFYDTVGTHFNAQRLAFREQAFKNTNNVATDNAVNATTDEERVAHADDAFTNTWMYYSEQKGMSDKIARTFAEEARSAVHKAVILSLVDNQPTAAREYYKKIEGDIDSGDKPGLAKALRGGYVTEKSAAAAAKVLGMPEIKGIKAQEKWIRDNETDVEVADEAVKRLKADLSIAETDRKQKNRELLEDTLKKIDDGSYTSPTDIPVALRTALIESRAMDGVLRAFDNKVRSGEPFSRVDDANAIEDLLDAVTAEDDPSQSALRELDLNDYKSRLSKRTWLQYKIKQTNAIKKYNGERQKGPKFDLGDEALREVTSVVFGKTPAKAAKGAFGKARAVVDDQLRRYLQKQFDAEQPVDEAELKRIAIRGFLKIQYTDNNTLFNVRRDSGDFRAQAEDGRAFALADLDNDQTIERVAAAVGESPAQTRKAIKLLTDNKKGPITIDKILRLFASGRAKAAAREARQQQSNAF
jgi:hypothetical protein